LCLIFFFLINIKYLLIIILAKTVCVFSLGDLRTSLDTNYYQYCYSDQVW